MTKELTASRLREVLEYQADTGAFIRLRNGKPAGTRHSRGYLCIAIDGRTYFAHRLAWLYTYGQWPESLIDHINRKRDDNRMSNLRQATHAENLQNTAVYANNTSGFKGVSWHARGHRWRAQIALHGKNKSLGLFETPEAAHAAYQAAAAELHSHH